MDGPARLWYNNVIIEHDSTYRVIAMMVIFMFSTRSGTCPILLFCFLQVDMSACPGSYNNKKNQDGIAVISPAFKVHTSMQISVK